MYNERINYLLNLQKQFKKGVIAEYEISDEDKQDLLKIYEFQNTEKKETNQKRLIELLEKYGNIQ